MKAICYFLLMTALMLEAAPGRDHSKGEDVLQKRQSGRCGESPYLEYKCIDVPFCPLAEFEGKGKYLDGLKCCFRF
ncbi:hypothetical protein ACROYT_G003535 [Oculina patagonica]